MAKHKNVYLNGDGCAYRCTKGTTNIIHTFLSMEDGKALKLARQWDCLDVKPKAILLWAEGNGSEGYNMPPRAFPSPGAASDIAVIQTSDGHLFSKPASHDEPKAKDNQEEPSES